MSRAQNIANKVRVSIYNIMFYKLFIVIRPMNSNIVIVHSRHKEINEVFVRIQEAGYRVKFLIEAYRSSK